MTTLPSAPSSNPSTWDWRALHATLAPRLVRAGVSRFGFSREECEDALQSAYLKALAHAARVRDPGAYLWTTFLNTCRDMAESRSRRNRHEVSVTPNNADNVGDEHVADRIESVCLVSGAFRRVDPRCRKVIVRYYVEGRSLAETAKATGYSDKTVWKRIQECLRRMRLCLG